jgi:hypothetical protein
MVCRNQTKTICIISGTFQENKQGTLKAKIDELETNTNIKYVRKLYRGVRDFKKVYQPKTNIGKDEKGDLVTDCYSIVARWRNQFSQLFIAYGFSDVRQREMHTAEPLAPEPNAFEVEMTID